MGRVEIQKLEQMWPSLTRFVFVPHSDKDYQRLVTFLDTLIDTIGEDESHPLASLMELIGVLVEQYEDEYVPEITAL